MAVISNEDQSKCPYCGLILRGGVEGRALHIQRNHVGEALPKDDPPPRRDHRFMAGRG
jgi:hypothetical protein